MALLKCPECKKPVSGAAKSCPSCGLPIDEQTLRKMKKAKQSEAIAKLVVVLLLVGPCLYYLASSGPDSSEPRAVLSPVVKDSC